MQANWTTAKGSKIEIKTTVIEGSSLSSIQVTINGKATSGAILTKAGGQDVIKFNGNVLLPVSAEIANEIRAERAESGKLTEMQLAKNQAIDEYDAECRNVMNAMRE